MQSKYSSDSEFGSDCAVYCGGNVDQAPLLQVWDEVSMSTNISEVIFQNIRIIRWGYLLNSHGKLLNKIIRMPSYMRAKMGTGSKIEKKQ